MPQIDLGKIVGDPGPQGPRGLQGNPGEKGETGSPGPGVAAGGAANQVLVKHSGTNFDTMWVDAGSLPVFSGVQYAVAIVADGNTHPAIADGQFVYVRNHSTLAEGLYKATAAIGTDVALTTSNLTADGSGGLNDLKGQIDSLNSKLETGNDFDFTLNSSQTSRFAINKKIAKIFGDIYVLCLVLNPLVDIGTGEIQLGDVSVSPALNTSTAVTRNSDTKLVGGANLLESRKLYMNLTESVNQGNYIYISFTTTYR